MFVDLGGAVRECSPEATLARIRPLMAQFGITRVASQEGLGNQVPALPVSIAFRPNARMLSTSQGKGITRELADVSAIMEGIEAFHAERLPPPHVRASPNQLRRDGRLFVDPATLAFSLYAALYDPDETVGWLTAKRLVDDAPILVPRFLFNLDATELKTERLAIASQGTSNGLASGNSFDEAIVHGLYEVIERHSVCECAQTLTREQQALRSVDLASVVEVPHLRELLARLDATELDVWVRACHGSLGIPTFEASLGSRTPLRRGVREGIGYGAHWVAAVALSRAITEAAQGRIVFVSGSRDDIYPSSYQMADASRTTQTLEHRVDPKTAFPTKLTDVPAPPRFTSFSQARAWTVAQLERHGLTDSCYYDHRRPEWGNIPVVSVVVPRLLFDKSVFHISEPPR